MTTVVQRLSKWRQVVDNHVVPLLESLKDRGIKPSLRTLHYNLISQPELGLPNTVNTYTKLSKYLVEARKEGRIAWDAISDNTRYTTGEFRDRYVSPDRHVAAGINYLSDSPEAYIDTVYKWHNQPHYVEIWIEKDALSSTFESFLEERHVKVVVNKGFASWTSLYENCKRLLSIRRNDPQRKIHVLYFGDYDPSGVDMDRHLHEAFTYFALEGPDCIDLPIIFERIAVTPEQIEQFDLPHTPEDEDTLAKLENDSRTEKFKENHNGELYAVELDALPALVPDEFEKLITEPVDRYYDEEIYEREVLNVPEHSEESIRRLVLDKISELQSELLRKQ